MSTLLLSAGLGSTTSSRRETGCEIEVRAAPPDSFTALFVMLAAVPVLERSAGVRTGAAAARARVVAAAFVGTGAKVVVVVVVVGGGGGERERAGAGAGALSARALAVCFLGLDDDRKGTLGAVDDAL